MPAKEGGAATVRPALWVHEIKHDGYRLIVQRGGKRVRLWARNGYGWSNHFPLITEAALRNRNTSFFLDGEDRAARPRRDLRLQRLAQPEA